MERLATICLTTDIVVDFWYSSKGDFEERRNDSCNKLAYSSLAETDSMVMVSSRTSANNKKTSYFSTDI